MKRRDFLKSAAIALGGAAIAPSAIARLVGPEAMSRAQFHPASAKAWCQFVYLGNASIVSTSYGIATIEDVGPGKILIKLHGTFKREEKPWTPL